MPKSTKTPPPTDTPERCTRLVPGARVLVHLDGEEVPGTVYLDGDSVDLDRRAKDDVVHPYKASDAFGRAARVNVGPARCSPLVDSPPPPKVCPHYGEAI